MRCFNRPHAKLVGTYSVILLEKCTRGCTITTHLAKKVTSLAHWLLVPWQLVPLSAPNKQGVRCILCRQRESQMSSPADFFLQQVFCIAIVCLSLTATKLWGTLLHKVATGIKLLARIRNTKSLCFRALNSLKEELNGILSVRTFRTNLRSEKDKLKTRRYDFALRKTPFKIAGFVLGV